MKRTDARSFLDSEVLLYAYSAAGAHRREAARKLAQRAGARVSAQAPSEAARVLRGKSGAPAAHAGGASTLHSEDPRDGQAQKGGPAFRPPFARAGEP